MVALTEFEQHLVSGAAGKAKKLAMDLMIAAADAAGATEFVEVSFAHINSSFYSGQVSLDFAEFLLAEGGSLAVPTHTNASLIDCTHPSLRPAAQCPAEVAGATRLMEIYELLGCTSMWTCAPYQQAEGRPQLGQQIIGSESNAVSFFNSVLGARTNKYGDFLDVCGAIVGRVPLSGLHTDEGRLATHVFRLNEIPDEMLADGSLHHVLGIVLGRESEDRVPVIVGLSNAEEDELKAIASAAATSGAVAMFHVLGVTPEAPSLEAATGGCVPQYETDVTAQMLISTRASLSTTTDEPLRAVCLGTPHFSVSEFEALITALAGRSVDPGINVIVTTSRSVLLEIELRGWVQLLADAGVQVIVDTCTYYTPRAVGIDGQVMTNSAKWAYYAPGILDVSVTFAGLAQCVESAVAGEVVL